MSSARDELNRIANEYHGKNQLEDKHIEDLCQHFTFDWVFSQLTESRTVLELGYGEGLFTRELVKCGYEVDVVEGSEILVQKAKNLFGNEINCIHSLFEEYETKKQYDCIVATHVLEHVSDPVELLRLMRVWIKPEGRIIIIVPNKESIHRRLAVLSGIQSTLESLSPRDHLVGHKRVYSFQTLRDDVESAGLQVVDEVGFFLKSLPNSMMLGFNDSLLVAMNRISGQVPKELLANIGIVATL